MDLEFNGRHEAVYAPAQPFCWLAAFGKARGWDESATIQFTTAGFTSLLLGFSDVMTLTAAEGTNCVLSKEGPMPNLQGREAPTQQPTSWLKAQTQAGVTISCRGT